MMDNNITRIEIAKAIKYLKRFSFNSPENIRVEEVGRNRIVLGFDFKRDGIWSSDWQYKEFIFRKGEVVAMKMFKL